jgi:flagellar protein FlaJ
LSKTQEIIGFRELGETLSKSGLKINLPSYLKMMLVWTAGIATSSVIMAYVVGILLHLPALTIIILEGSAGLISTVVTFTTFYMYPKIRADIRKNKLENEIPYIVSHMATLAVSGLTPEQIFYYLAELPKQEIAEEARRIVRDFTFLGMDLFSALESARDRSVSKAFAELIDGFIAAARAGGNLQVYLIALSKAVTDERRIKNKKSTDTLGVLAEVYITLLIIFPLMSIMMGSMMGSILPSIGSFNIQLILMLITYVATPMLAVIILVVFSIVLPSRR